MAPKGVREADWEEANDPKNKAEKPGYEQLKNRSCTDCLCCVIFLVFIITVVALGAYGFAEGDVAKLATPFDQEGNECGKPDQPGGDFTEYPYKFITGLFSSNAVNDDGSFNFNVFASLCVRTCPEQTDQLDCKTVSSMDSSINGGNGNGIDDESCPYSALNTNNDMIESYCIPAWQDGRDLIVEMYQDLAQQEDGAGKYIADVANSWQTLVIMIFGTLILAAIYVWLLQFIVKPLMYLSMVLIIALFAAVGVYAWMQKDVYLETTAGSTEEDQNYQMFKIGAYVAWVLAGCTVCCICCCWNNIMLGAALMEASSQFVSANLRIIFTPLLAYTLSMIFFAWWIVSATWLYSMGEVKSPGNPNLQMLPDIELDDVAFGIMWYYLFALFWITAFFMSLQKFIIASAATLWYFDPADGGEAAKSVSICEAMTWGIWYHCGTIAFGSFIIALVQLIRAIFEYISQKADEAGGDNAAKKAVECVIRCCLWCLDQCVKYITENAYIQCAVSNTSFCPSAWNAFTLMIRNAGRFSTLGMVDWMLMLLGKGTIVSASVVVTYVVADRAFPLIQQPLIPGLLILAYAYVVASLFLSIFSFAARTILHCFLLDEETSDGAIVAPACLQKFLDEHDEIKNKEGDFDAPKKNDMNG